MCEKFCGDLGGCATSAGVDSADDASRVEDEDRQTIGGFDGEGDAWSGGNKSIYVIDEIFWLGNGFEGITMDLFHEGWFE